MGSIPVNEPKTRGRAYLLYLDRDKLPEVLQEFGFKGRTSASTSSNRES